MPNTPYLVGDNRKFNGIDATIICLITKLVGTGIILSTDPTNILYKPFFVFPGEVEGLGIVLIGVGCLLSLSYIYQRIKNRRTIGFLVSNWLAATSCIIVGVMYVASVGVVVMVVSWLTPALLFFWLAGEGRLPRKSESMPVIIK